MTDILSRKNEVILTQKKVRVQKKIRTVLKLIRVVISILKDIESINITAEMIKKNKKNLMLLKKCQLVNTDKDK